MDAATLTVLAKIKNSYNTQVLALAKTFSHEIYPLYGNKKSRVSAVNKNSLSQETLMLGAFYAIIGCQCKIGAVIWPGK